ncbi:unnamed protein product [Hymenolepis diminuta]|uniref:Transcription and mRNA export factor ENY2 n=1 Tax=Hymenolepis diminuta TaxID=6216 RepID=A0A564YN42_HYMDI|nr:unnamed protein product [Hymenolepis diminuta]
MSTASQDCARVRKYLHEQLIATGERDKLKDLLRTRLLECGWREDLKTHCKELITNRGLTYVTVNDLVTELTPIARKNIPDSVKKELVDAIRNFLPKENGDNGDDPE